MKADLHMHTTASDGTMRPEQIVAEAQGKGMTHIAVTDHDSVAAIGPATREAARRGMALIPGVELSCGAAKEIHILGYGFDSEDEGLLAFCRARTAEREERARQMVQQLGAAGVPISLGRVRELARGVVGRPHVARVLVEAGYASSVSDAFDRYLVPGRCGYVPKHEVKVAQAVEIITCAGGVAVLAHPMELKMGDMALEALIGEWKAQGLAGIEVYHPSAANHQAAYLLRLAQRMGMLVTGGSDFHGENVRSVEIGQGLDRWAHAEQDVATLLSRCSRTC